MTAPRLTDEPESLSTQAEESPPSPSRSRRRLALSVAGLAALASAVLALRAFPPFPFLPAPIHDGVTVATSVIVESFPFVVLGIALAIVVQVWLPPTWIARALPRRPFPRRIVVSLLGMFFPVCECGNVPLARGLLARGLSVPESITFVAAAPILNPITIITTQQAFGWDWWILGGRILGGFALANLLGWIFSTHEQPTALLTPAFAAACTVSDHDHGSRWERSARQFGRECGAIMPALLLGAAVAAIVQTVIPRNVLLTIGANPLLSVTVMILLAFVVAVCSNVDAFFVMSFSAAFLPGSVLAFLLFGPVMDVKMLALLRTTFTTGTVLRIGAVTAVFAAALGLAVNLLA